MLKVLLVDDSAEIRRAFGQRLRRIEGVDGVDCAEGLEQALASLAECRYDVVVVDVQLRGNERGLDLVRHVVAHHPGTEIAMLSNFGWESMREGFLRVGAAAYFEKGTEAADLLAWVGERARATA